MPLSEHEQRLFEQIERSLAEDPKFASAVRASDPRFHTRRRLLVAAGVVVVGLALLVYGAVIKTPPLAVAGFVVMLAALGYAVQSHRRGHPSPAGARRAGSPRRCRGHGAGRVRSRAAPRS
ncbi:DUF3040 domain-containing protein, partial [Micromonospora wenchangensis]